jgi:hypothetical protein
MLQSWRRAFFVAIRKKNLARFILGKLKQSPSRLRHWRTDNLVSRGMNRLKKEGPSKEEKGCP